MVIVLVILCVFHWHSNCMGYSFRTVMFTMQKKNVQSVFLYWAHHFWKCDIFRKISHSENFITIHFFGSWCAQYRMSHCFPPTDAGTQKFTSKYSNQIIEFQNGFHCIDLLKLSWLKSTNSIKIFVWFQRNSN